MNQTLQGQKLATMTRQPPLPMLPGEARPIGDAAGVCEYDHGGVVFIWGNAALTTTVYSPLTAWSCSIESVRFCI